MNKMEHMEIKQLVVSMSLPIIISMVIQALYNIVDSIFVAKVSSDALTAVSLCYPVQTIMIAIACGTAVGFNTLLARYLGEKKFDYAFQPEPSFLRLASTASTIHWFPKRLLASLIKSGLRIHENFFIGRHLTVIHKINVSIALFDNC